MREITDSQIEPELNVWRHLNFQWVMFCTFEKLTSSIMFKSCVCRCPIPGLLGN